MQELVETQKWSAPKWTYTKVLIVAWAILGVLALLLRAVMRMAPIALEPIKDQSLTPAQAVVYAGWCGVSLYAEGYRGFQMRFSPRVVARALYLANNPKPLHVLLAPLYCMAFFHASLRGLMAAWGVLLIVIAAVLVVHVMPQPWRGIVDGGVVLGLAWGMASLVVIAANALRGRHPGVSAELPR